MNTVEELVHYCRESDPLGALMLTGDWGSGKTHLIENDLKEALGPDYAIVRVSLFGVNNINALQDKVRKEWVSVCYPFMNRFHERREIAQKNSAIINMILNILRKFNPFIGSTADILNSMNILDTIHVEPTFEDEKTHKKRRAILVFDDMERSSIPMADMLGAINECCENRHFNTIVVTNMKYMMSKIQGDLTLLQMLREKAITQTVLYTPDYVKVIHQIIMEKEWREEEYRQFLLDNEELIVDVFAGDPLPGEEGSVYEKSHNLLTLTVAMKSFYRIYYHLRKSGVGNISEYLASFIAFVFCSNKGIVKNGKADFEFDDEEVRMLYPQFDPEKLFPSVRKWIITGGFDEDRFYDELREYTGTGE